MRFLGCVASIALSFCEPAMAVAITRCETFPPGGYVGLFADSLAQDSTIALAPGPGYWHGVFHVVAVLNGAVAGGITKAEFRVHLPFAPAMFITTTMSPELNLHLGQMFEIGTDAGGIIVAFSQCQHGHPGAGGKVVVPIARVQVLSLAAFDTPVLVKKMSTPDPRAPCPIFAKCDATFSPAPMWIRGTDELGEETAFRGRMFCKDATVGAAGGTWTTVKRLYR